MFWSDITYEKLIDEVKSEVDIAVEINDEIYMRWLNTLITFLYTEIIKEQTTIVLEPAPTRPFTVTVKDYDYELKKLNFEDIVTIYADDIQLIKSTAASGAIFQNTFYKEHELWADTYDYKIGYNTKTKPNKLTIVYYIRPLVNYPDGFVELPNEFIDLAKSKLRGEAYKLANEDALAAKWLNDYNTLLETFKVWIAEKSSKFGL